MIAFRSAALTFSALAFACVVSAADWQQPWDAVKAKSVASCQETFEDFQLQAVCMKNEKEGYQALQEDYGMPQEVAVKAKKRCEKTFSGQFQLQDVCMKNEKEGYDQMSSY